MMEKWLDDILPILSVENDLILSKQGDITMGFEVKLPEIFTLSLEEYEAFHHAWIKAIKVLPAGTAFHKQDWFREKRFKVGGGGDNQKSFLSKCSGEFFNGRKYLDHECFIFLTKRNSGRKLSSFTSSNLIRKSIVPVQAINPNLMKDFLDACGQFKKILEDSGFVKMKSLPNDELLSDQKKAGVIEKYCFLLEDDSLIIKDISFKDGIRIGDQSCQLFTLSSPIDLPALCGSRVNYDRYSTDRTKFSVGFASALGQLLPCNHIYSQYIFIEQGQKTIRQLESKRLRLQSLSAYSRENAIAKEATNDFLNEAAKNQRIPVKAHFNILVWSKSTDKKDELKDLQNMVSSALAQMEVIPKIEVDGAPQIFWAGIPSNAGDFPMSDSFDTFIEQAVCFLNLESSDRSVANHSTIQFGERLTGKPVHIDLFDEPMKKGMITNRGMFVCGSSGGGKSMLCNHIFRSLYDQGTGGGAHIVIVDIGGSYKGLCDLVGGYYFTYTEKDPIRFNPFYLAKGEVLDTEKKESLKALLVTLWKQEHETFNRSEYVALSNALQGYYFLLERDASIFPSFNTFYEYLESTYIEVLKKHRVKDRDFDVENFLYVLRPYYKDGEFDYLLNADKNLDLLSERFIVFELDNIKDHPILFPVVTLIIMELFISKMRKLKGILKVLGIEEAWKAMAKSGMAEFMKYGFKTLRKFHGIPVVVTQEIDDLISSPIIKDAIIGNSDIKILMDMRKFANKFDPLQATLGMSAKGKTQLFSVNRANEPGRKYREFYLELGGQVSRVLRYEPSPEEYYTYTTEQKEKTMVQQYAERYGSFQKGIEALVKELKKNEN